MSSFFCCSKPKNLSDSNLVKIGHIKKDMLKGFKVGMIGNAPFFILTGVVVAMAIKLAPKFYTVWYAFLSGHFYSFIIWISRGAKTLGELNVIQLVLFAIVQFVVPVVSGVAYILGFKEINIAEKIVYTKEVK